MGLKNAWILCAFLVTSLVCVALGTSTFKMAPRPRLGVIPQYRCPVKYNATSPWTSDTADCACYFVCHSLGGAVRMCCPKGLWWNDAQTSCDHIYNFNTQHAEQCLALSRGIGTTPQLREIFMGHCWEYQKFINPDSLISGYINCDKLFDTFATAWVGRGPCGEVKQDAYVKLIQDAKIQMPRDSQLFWSGTYDVAQELANRGRRMYTLETTLIGYILNDVTWCGQTEQPGINFVTCPAFASCSDHVMANFWAKALEWYAKEAQGVVTVLLNGSRSDGPAYRNNSFFAEHELPNLDPKKVSKIRVWVQHDLDKPYTENCSGGSLRTFQRIAEAKGFAYECQDNPASLRHLLCISQPNTPSCRFLGYSEPTPTDQAPPQPKPTIVQQAPQMVAEKEQRPQTVAVEVAPPLKVQQQPPPNPPQPKQLAYSPQAPPQPPPRSQPQDTPRGPDRPQAPPSGQPQAPQPGQPQAPQPGQPQAPPPGHLQAPPPGHPQAPLQPHPAALNPPSHASSHPPQAPPPGYPQYLPPGSNFHQFPSNAVLQPGIQAEQMHVLPPYLQGLPPGFVPPSGQPYPAQLPYNPADYPPPQYIPLMHYPAMPQQQQPTPTESVRREVTDSATEDNEV